VVRVAVVPGDELRRGVRTAEILSGDPQPLVGGRADRVADDVVALQQLLATDVVAQLDVAEDRNRSC
jgi:hypothetical protein